MWLTVLLMCIGLQVSARYSQYSRDTVSDEDLGGADEPLPSVGTMLDMRGTLKKFFALEAALGDHQRNMICSPMSAMIPLGKLALGSEKETEREMMTALGMNSKKQIWNVFDDLRTKEPGLEVADFLQVKDVFAQLLENIKKIKHVPSLSLYMISRLDVNSKKNFNRKFLKTIKKIFKPSIAEKLKVGDPIKTAKEINGWVSGKTGQFIRNVIDPSDIVDDTSVILINAIYFTGKWKNRFKTVSADDFHAPSGKKKIPMMSRSGHYNYWQCEKLNAQIIEIPYEREGTSMIIVLPFSKNGLPALLNTLKLDPELLNQALENMKTANVLLSMPKFRIESEFDMSELYRRIGIRTIFDPKSSRLTGIVDNEVVFVTKSIHKAIIEVNEIGVDAAGSGPTVAPIKFYYHPLHVTMKVDRPFLFYVKYDKQQALMGSFYASEILQETTA